MKLVLLCLALMLQGLPPLVGPLIPDVRGSVAGVIRRADTGQPLSDAEVALVSQGESVAEAFSHAIATDGNGRFTIRNVQPNSYTLVVRREGYFEPTEDPPISTVVAREVTVSEGQRVEGIAVALTPGSIISGRILNSNREPVIGAVVEALQAIYVRGRLTFTTVKAAESDDLGEYRLFWLPPGDYVIRAQYRPSSPDRLERFGRVFYPGISSESDAPRLRIRSGAETSAIDFSIPTTSDAGATVSGKVTSATLDLSDRPVSAIYVVPRDRTVTLATDAADAFPNQIVGASSGRFEIRGVQPGEYNLFPVVRDAEGRSHTARLSIDVGREDVQDLVVEVTPGVELRGRVTLNGTTSPRLLTNPVLLTSLDGLPGALLSRFGAARSGAEALTSMNLDAKTGEFVFPDVPPGRYAIRITPSLVAADAYIADMRQGSISVFDRGVTIGGEPPEAVELSIRTVGGEITGTTARLTRNPTVVLVPEPGRRSNATLYRNVTASGDGRFRFTGIAPGQYKLFAWDMVTPGAWENAQFIGQYEDYGVPVEVVAGESQSILLKVIPK